uniref:Uncharacterized protein n=1 Tax=Rhizophora mucronata TaxID=61149 RepID=A0A2P2R3G0_RHIMU
MNNKFRVFLYFPVTIGSCLLVPKK